MKIYSSVPAKFVVGDTLVVEIELPDYPAPTYSLTLTLVSAAAKLTVVSSASGAKHLLSVDTSTLSAGRYDYQLQLSGEGYRSTYKYGTVTAEPDFSDESLSSHDGRKWYETAIDALEASIAGRASKVQLRQVVFGTEVQELTQDEQLSLLQRLYTIKRQRELQEKKGKGKTLSKTIGVRF